MKADPNEQLRAASTFISCLGRFEESRDVFT
jgi:hypothetical protein